MIKEKLLTFYKNIKLKHLAIISISLVLVVSIVIVSYVYNLLGSSQYTFVPIVDELDIKDGILDDQPTPGETKDQTPVEVETNNNNDPNVTPKPTQKPVPVYWGEGRIRVYVDSRFPIRRVEQKDKNIENYLIIGLDARSVYESIARTDSIIVISVDKKNNSIKLTSILRDTQVKIPGRTYPEKINAAYVFGGIGLLINTINENFDLDIQKFAMVDMWSAENVINIIDGVNINITREEMSYINSTVKGANNTFKYISDPSPMLTEPGLVLLDGRQAVAYGRIRKIGSDFQRTERQRKVLSESIIQFKAASPSKKLQVFESVAKSFETNVTKSEMVVLAFDVLSGMRDIRQYRVPDNGMYTTNTTNWQLIVNHEMQIPALHDFIWGNKNSGTIRLPSEMPDPTMSPTPTLTPNPTPTVAITPTPTLNPWITPEVTRNPPDDNDNTPAPEITPSVSPIQSEG